MPIKLPSPEDLGDAPKLLSGRPIATVDYSPIGEGAMAIGKAVSGVGRDMAGVAHVLNRQAEKDKAENDYTAGLAAEADFKVNQVKLDTLASDLNDPDKLNEHKPRYQGALEAAAEKIADPKQKEQFLLRNQPAVANSQARLDGKIAKIGLDRDLASLDNDLYTMKESALKNPDQAQADEAIQAANLKLDAYVREGKIDAVKAVTMKRAWAQDYSEQRSLAMPPKERIAALSGNPGEVAKTAFRAMKDEGLTDVQAAGFIGNFKEESAFNPGNINRGEGAAGLGQWRADRLADLKAFAAARKTDWTDPETQARFAVNEMKTKYPDAWARLQAATTPAEAAEAVVHWEKPGGWRPGSAKGVPSLRARQDHADSYYAALTGNAPLPDSKGVQYAQYIPNDRKQAIIDGARRQVAAQDQEATVAIRQEATTVGTLMKRDGDQVAQTGTPIKELTPERVEASLGTEAKAEFLSRREAASDYHDQTTNWSRMTPTEIAQSVERLNPAPYEGTGKWNLRQEYYDKARTAAEAALKQRQDDPAGAVAQDPVVQQTVKDYEATGGKRPQDFKTVVDARLQAQELIGVPDDQRRVATADEVDHYASILRPMAKGQIEAMEQNQQSVINNAIDEIFTKYGDEHAQQVISAVMSKVSLSKEAGEIASAVVANARNNPYGPVIPAKERQKLQQLQQTQMIENATRISKMEAVDAADMAQKGRPSTRAAMADYARGRAEDPPPPAEIATSPAASAPQAQAGKVREILDWAMRDPDKNIPQVIQQYGPEAAKRILGAQYEAHLFRTKQQGQ